MNLFLRQGSPTERSADAAAPRGNVGGISAKNHTLTKAVGRRRRAADAIVRPGRWSTISQALSTPGVLLEEALPELARFFGIIVRMYAEPGAPHHRPHFHVYYQNYAAVYSIEPVEMIGGDLPRRQRRLVEAWAELHQGELRENLGTLAAGVVAVQDSPSAVKENGDGRAQDLSRGGS